MALVEVKVPDIGDFEEVEVLDQLLEKASKAAPRVAVYVHREPESWLARLAGERIHRAEQIAIHVMDRELIAAMATRLERRMEFDLSVAERNLYVTLGDETLSGVVTSRELPSR